MAYTNRTRRLVSAVRADLAAITDQQTRDLVAAWVTAWNEVAPDLNAVLVDMLISGDKITRAAMLRSSRLQQVLAIIANHLEQLTGDAHVRIVGDLRQVLDIAGGAQASIIDSQLPPHAGQLVDLQAWSRVDERALEAIVRRSTEQITSRLRPLSREADRAVRAELLRGFSAGSNPRQTAGRVLARAEGRFNGGLTRAMAIARTETLDASRAGGHIGRMQHADVLEGWEWHCELSRRSCPACIAQDGTLHPLDEPGPNDHVNGRCTAVPRTKSWADLGFDIAEPADLRQSGQDWFADQSADVQKSILGPGRYDAWRAGHYPPEAWSQTVHNADWRTSVQVSRTPAGYRNGQSGGRAAGSSLAS